MQLIRNVQGALLTGAAVAIMLASPVSAATAEAAVTVPVAGTPVGGGTFSGTFDIKRFVVDDGVVKATGTVTGMLTDAAGASKSVVSNVEAPATVTQATCDILHLELGPLSLDLLGLVVNLNQVILDIDAESGPGNLLGNLLCAIVGLLDQPAGLAKALNEILGILG